MIKFFKENFGITSLNSCQNYTKIFLKNQRGNVGIMFAICALPLLAGIGTAIDYTQMTSDVQKAQDSADTAVLSAASAYYNEFLREDSVMAGQISSQKHMETETATGEHIVTTTIEPSGLNSYSLKSSISGTSRHAFMGIFGSKETKWTVEAYSELSIPKIEIILVVDVSASMAGAKIANLKTALRKFVEDVTPYRKGDSHISVSMIPFAENVNLGIGSASWLSPADPSSTGIFEGCFMHSDQDRPGLMESYDLTRRKNGYHLCPPHGSKTVLFAADPAPLNISISTLGLAWGTDTEQGLFWAERFLDNDWRNQARSFAASHPIQITDSTQKIVVLLTDGAIAVTDSNQDGITDSGRVLRSRKGKSVREFTAQCNKMKTDIKNLHMYTVGYNLSDGAMKNTLKNCITGDGGYFDAQVGNLDDVFQKVSDSLTPIRISG